MSFNDALIVFKRVQDLLLAMPVTIGICMEYIPDVQEHDIRHILSTMVAFDEAYVNNGIYYANF